MPKRHGTPTEPWHRQPLVVAVAAAVIGAVVGGLTAGYATPSPSLGPLNARLTGLKTKVTILEANNAQMRKQTATLLAAADRARAAAARGSVEAALHLLPLQAAGASADFRRRLRAAAAIEFQGDALYTKKRWQKADAKYEDAANLIFAHCPARLLLACALLLRSPNTPLSFHP